MHTIYKYILDPNKLEIQMPASAEILTANSQRDNLCVWARVHTDNMLVTRRFVVYGTGHPMDDNNIAYVGTALMDTGALVLHVFELLD